MRSMHGDSRRSPQTSEVLLACGSMHIDKETMTKKQRWDSQWEQGSRQQLFLKHGLFQSETVLKD